MFTIRSFHKGTISNSFLLNGIHFFLLFYSLLQFFLLMVLQILLHSSPVFGQSQAIGL